MGASTAHMFVILISIALGLDYNYIICINVEKSACFQVH